MKVDSVHKHDNEKLTEEKPINEISQLLIEDKANNEDKPKGLYGKIKELMNPPIASALIATPLALIPYLPKYVLTGSGAVFQANLFTAGQMMGACVSPLICVLLGSKLSHGYPQSATISK